MLGLYGLLSLAGVLVAGPAADFMEKQDTHSHHLCHEVVLFLIVFRYKSITSLYVFALASDSPISSPPSYAHARGKLYGVRHLVF
jgi:hypothetical protein